MSGEEDLDRNPFFVALREDTALFDQASRNRLIICIPQSRSLSLLRIDQNLFKTHILQSSPYFQEEFVSLSGKCVTIKGSNVSTRAGFGESRTAKILFEETFYNAESKSFRVLCLNSPLEGAFPAGCTDDAPAGGHSLARSHAEQQNWLRQAVPRMLLPPGANTAAAAVKAKSDAVDAALDALLRQCAQFNASYVMVKAFFSHAADKLRGSVEKAMAAVIDQSDAMSQLGSTENQHGELWLALEAVCLGATHDKVISNLVEFTRDKESALTALCYRLVKRQAPAANIGAALAAAAASSSSLTSNLEAALHGPGLGRRASVSTAASSSLQSSSSATTGSSGGGGGGSSPSAPASVWMLFADGQTQQQQQQQRTSNVALPQQQQQRSASPSKQTLTPPGSNSGGAQHLLPFIGVGPRLGARGDSGKGSVDAFSLESLGLRAPLCGLDVSAAVERLLTLNAVGARNTPVARLLVLKEVSEAIRDAVDAEVARLRAPPSNSGGGGGGAANGAAGADRDAAAASGGGAASLGDLALTADDLLPLWVYTIVQACVRSADRATATDSSSSLPAALHVHANMDYMCYFHTPPPAAPHLTSELQFHLANFQAALAYIENSLVHSPAALAGGGSSLTAPATGYDFPVGSSGGGGGAYHQRSASTASIAAAASVAAPAPSSFMSAASAGALGMMGAAASMGFGSVYAANERAYDGGSRGGIGGGMSSSSSSSSSSLLGGGRPGVDSAPAVSGPPGGGGGGFGKQRKSISIDHLFSNGAQSQPPAAVPAPAPASTISTAAQRASVQPITERAPVSQSSSRSSQSQLQSQSQYAPSASASALVDTSFVAPAVRALPLSRAELDASEGEFLARLRRQDDEVVYGNVNRWRS